MSRILVLGGAKAGIGQAITLQLLKSGHEVVASFEPESEKELAAFMEEQRSVTWISLDSRSEESMDRLQQLKSIDGAIVAEFYFYMENRGTFDSRAWNRSLFVNLTLPKFIGHLAINTWASCRSVVFVTSSEANTGSFGAHAYAASKAAVHNLTKSLANVAAGACRFNAVAAGWIGGVMDTDEVFNMSRQITPLGRLGSPDEVAKAALWMLSDDASFVNGTTLFADGGYTGVDTISKFEFESEFGELKSSSGE